MMRASIIWPSLPVLFWVLSASATDRWILAKQGTNSYRVIAAINATSIRNKTDVAGWVATATPDRIKAARDSVKLAKKTRKLGEAQAAHVGPAIEFEGRPSSFTRRG